MDEPPINWSEIAGAMAAKVRPETASKYFPPNPLRRFIINRFLRALGETLAGFSWQNLLDVGCGEGFVDYYLGKKFPGRTLTGVDPDPQALAVARFLNPAFTYQEADGRQLPFADRSFDAVICLEVLEHLTDYPRVIKEVKRLSRGPCLFSVPAWPYYQATNFLIGKNWSHFGEHPDHVVQFSARRFRRELAAEFGSAQVRLAYPWLVGVSNPKS